MTMFGFPTPEDSYGIDPKALPEDLKDTSQIVTIWFLTAKSVSEVLATNPKADRGFGRKLLAQIHPGWEVTHIGDFPLNRSTPTSYGEFYIAGYPGLTVIQTVLQEATSIEHIDQRLLHSLPAREIFVFSRNPATGSGGFMHIKDNEIQRAFAATCVHIFNDTGLPAAFEAPFWAGEVGEPRGGIYLPFEPLALVSAAEKAWLGVEISANGPDVNISAFAVDGRPAPRFDEHGKPLNLVELSKAGPTGSTGITSGYDDYEEHRTHDGASGDEFARLAEASAAAARRVRRSLWSKLRATSQELHQRLRNTDR